MLELKEITKKYNHVPVVKKVSFTVKPGEILGYLGPNGAGKSTTVKMLAGLVEPNSGHILLEGERIHPSSLEYKRRIGYLPEQGDLYGHLSGFEHLQLIGRLRNIPEKELNQRIMGLMEQLELGIDMHLSISSYSKGMKQKVLLSAALLHNPDILLLDEPLSGLDVTTTMVFKEVLKRLSAMGKIVIYSSHILEVVEKVCTRVIIIDEGTVVADDSIDRLSRLMELPTLESIFNKLVRKKDTMQRVDKIIGLIQPQSSQHGSGRLQ
ncbi:MAG: ABC transporter ATP-binding protein [bacterium]|nr:ABC transporter ATP-binding protein [bacterium]